VLEGRSPIDSRNASLGFDDDAVTLLKGQSPIDKQASVSMTTDDLLE
jgi:hypothetical protein